jgi:hypothetical protein
MGLFFITAQEAKRVPSLAAGGEKHEPAGVIFWGIKKK